MWICSNRISIKFWFCFLYFVTGLVSQVHIYVIFSCQLPPITSDNIKHFRCHPICTSLFHPCFLQWCYSVKSSYKVMFEQNPSPINIITSQNIWPVSLGETLLDPFHSIMFDTPVLDRMMISQWLWPVFMRVQNTALWSLKATSKTPDWDNFLSLELSPVGTDYS